MSKSKAISRPFEQTAQQRAELDALRRMLDISEGTFSLSVAVCNSPALRDHIIEHVTGEVEGIQAIRIAEDARNVFDLVRKHIPDGSPRAIFVVDLEKALGEDKRSRVLQGLNVSREQWQASFQCPVIFWLPEYAMSLVMTHARDLWSWVSHSFEFVSEQGTAMAGMQDSYAGNITLASNLDVHEKRFRIAELEQRIASVGEEPNGQMKEHVPVWLNELAYLYMSLGELDRAERTFQEALEISQEHREFGSMAAAYANLGVICRTRGDLDGAEKMLHKSLALSRRLGWFAGMASQYGSLGVISAIRGNLDEAESKFNKALNLSERLGWLEGIATSYGNLAAIYQARGDFNEAEKTLRKSLEIDERLGRRESIATQYANLGLICQARGNLDEAEKMLNKAIDIDRKLGQMEGIATASANLGTIYEARGDLAQARANWAEALALFQKIGAHDRMRAVEASINSLSKNNP